MTTTAEIAPVSRVSAAVSRARGFAGTLFSGQDRARLDAMAAFLVRCVSAGTLYLSQVAMARWMGAAEYGLYVSVWTSVLLAGGIAHLGLNLATIRLVPLHKEAGDLALLRGLVDGARAFAFAMGLAAAAIGALALWLAAPQLSDGYRTAATIALLCIPFYAVTDVQDGIGRGHGWMMAALLPPYILRPLLVLSAMAVAHAAGAPMTATTAVWSAVVATATAGIVQAVWLGLACATAHGSGPRAYVSRDWLAVSLPLLLSGAAEMLLQNIDVLVLTLFARADDVAVYFAAGKTMSLIMFIHYAVGSAMASRFASFGAHGDLVGLRGAVRGAVNLTFWPSLAAALVLLLAGRPLLSLFGPRFADGFPVMAILVFGFLARSSVGPVEFLLNMMGEQRRCARVMMQAGLLDLLLALVLVPWWGTTGAALATATALAYAALANAAVARRHLGLEVGIWANWANPLKHAHHTGR